MKQTRESWKRPGDTTELDAMIDQWMGRQGNAAYTTDADVDNDEDRCIEFNLVPGEDILVGYANALNQELATPLTERVAKILVYNCDFD